MRTDLPYPGPVDCEKPQAPMDQNLYAKMRAEQEYATECGAQAQRQMTSAEILAELFSYHPPNEATLPKFQAINQAAKNFAEVILQNCPYGADRSTAIRLIREARMTANAAIALNGLSL